MGYLTWRLRLTYEKINWNLIRELPAITKLLFQSNFENRRKITELMRKTISPILGFIGITCVGIFTPIKFFLKFKGENSRLLNALASIGFTSQNIYYFFKFTLPESFDIKSKKTNASKLLFSLGLASNATNMALPFIELIPNDKVRNLLSETALGLNKLFFSIRRNFLGNRWLEINKEE